MSGTPLESEPLQRKERAMSARCSCRALRQGGGFFSDLRPEYDIERARRAGEGPMSRRACSWVLRSDRNASLETMVKPGAIQPTEKPRLTAGECRIDFLITAFPPGQTRKLFHPGLCRLPGGAIAWVEQALFDNPVLVIHETHTRVRLVGIELFCSVHVKQTQNRVSGNLHYSTVSNENGLRST